MKLPRFRRAVMAALVMGGVGVASASAQVAPRAKGGSLTDLISGAQWPGLDPATDNQDAADATMLNQIYGGLFYFGPGGTVMPDEAQSWTFKDHNLMVDINLRHGLKFSDGNPMTASDVVTSIDRDLLPSNGCICDADFKPVSSITAVGSYTVQLQLSQPYTAVLDAFNGTAPNWTIDPVALNSVGEVAFAQSPVGAGPFKVVHNTASATLQLTKNPNYWEKGYPLLDNLTFESVGSDQSGFASLQSGQAQAMTTVTTISVIQQAKRTAGFAVHTLPATFYEFVSLNDKVAPFNNEKARLALIEATNSKALVSSLYGNLYRVTEGPTAPGEPFYQPQVPGYPGYNLKKATALVQSIGGLSVTLATTSNTSYWSTEATALDQAWTQAGIKVTLSINTLGATLNQLETGNWQALDSNWGAADPAVALPTYFSSSGPFTGIHDPTLDGLIEKGAAYANPSTRAKYYSQIDERMAKDADAVFMYSKPFFALTKKSVKGIDNNNPVIYWERVSV